MKENTYFALTSGEFLSILEKISREEIRLTIKKSKKNQISIRYNVILPIAIFSFYIVEELNDSIKVKRKIRWYPLIISSILLLGVLEAMMFLVSFLVKRHNFISYVLITGVWTISIFLLIYQTFEALDSILSNIYMVQV